jgi:hypothetical protein
MNNTAIKQWLQFAPGPAALTSGKRFHVFISYRSVNRLWVLQLYDLLRGLGYEVFLDQYVLAAAAPLALSLNDALAGSQTAIMIWSSAFEDSEWCMKEYNTLENLEAARTGFRYLIAQLDEAPLPPMAGQNTRGLLSGPRRTKRQRPPPPAAWVTWEAPRSSRGSDGCSG